MTDKLENICRSQTIPGRPAVTYSNSKNAFYHVYQHVPLQTDQFQAEIKSYLSRKQSFSGNVLAVLKIKDEKISYNSGNPSMEISVVTEFVPWRLHLQQANLSFEQGLFVLDGVCKGFRELLHRFRIPFLIQQDMIGIDGNGKVKVWWNEVFYKGKMKSPVFQPIKLKSMIKSLILAIESRMTADSVTQLQKIIQGCQNFQSIQQRVKLNSKGLKLQYFGKKLIKSCPQFDIIQSQVRQVRQESILQKSKSDASINISKLSSLNQISPVKNMNNSTHSSIPIQFSKRIIVRKRHLGLNNSISPDEKMKYIKSDIEELRQQSFKKQRNVETKLRSAKSVGSLHSYNLGITGNQHIPEVKNMAKQQKMFENQENSVKISRFIEPRMNLKMMPQRLNLSNSIEESRLYISKLELKSKGSIYLPELKGGIFNSKIVNSTDRTLVETKTELMNGSPTQRTRYLQSGNKTMESPYLSAFDI